MSIQPQPLTIFGQLIESTHGILTGGAAVNELELKRIEREVEKLARVSQADSFEVRAQIAAIRRDDDECDRLYGAALKSSSDYTGAVVRYLSVLSHTSRPKKLLEMYRALGASLKGNPEATRFVEGLLAGEGFLVSAWSLAEDLGKMGSFSAASPQCPSERATQFLDVEGLSDEELGAPVEFVKNFLHGKGTPSRSYRVGGSVASSSRDVIFFQLHIDTSPEAASFIETELFEALEKHSFAVEAQGKIVFAVIGTRVTLN